MINEGSALNHCDFAALPSLFLMKGRLNAHEESVSAILLYYHLKLL